jgi:hypothetical protein
MRLANRVEGLMIALTGRQWGHAGQTHRRPLLGRRTVVFLAGLVIALVIVGMIHVLNMPEDSAPIWICSVMGDGQCGPDAAPIYIKGING